MVCASVTLVAAVAAFVLAQLGIAHARANAAAALGQLAATSDRVSAVQEEAQIASETGDARAKLAALALPSGGDANFISAIEELAGEAHISLAVASVAAVPPSGTLPGTLTLSLQITGSWSACVRFLQLIETQSLAENIPSVSFTYDAPNKQWQGTIAVSIVSFDSP